MPCPRTPRPRWPPCTNASLSLTLAIEAFGGNAPDRKAETKTHAPAPSSPNDGKVHGTISGYQRGCRCEPCRSARSIYQKSRTAKRKAELRAQSQPEASKSEGPEEKRSKTGLRHGELASSHGLATETVLPHGSIPAYKKGCRCEKCTMAYRKEYNREYHQSRKGTPTAPIAAHGTVGSYGKGCRCEACKLAKSDYTKAKAAEKKEQLDA